MSSVQKLVVNCVISRVDYCNSIYWNLPKKQLKKLENILNRAARLIKGISRRDRITPVLIGCPLKPELFSIFFLINSSSTAYWFTIIFKKSIACNSTNGRKYQYPESGCWTNTVRTKIFIDCRFLHFQVCRSKILQASSWY